MPIRSRAVREVRGMIGHQIFESCRNFAGDFGFEGFPIGIGGRAGAERKKGVAHRAHRTRLQTLQPAARLLTQEPQSPHVRNLGGDGRAFSRVGPIMPFDNEVRAGVDIAAQNADGVQRGFHRDLRAVVGCRAAGDVRDQDIAGGLQSIGEAPAAMGVGLGGRGEDQGDNGSDFHESLVLRL